MPETLRERSTGTCDREECYVSFNDTENIKYHEQSFVKYKFSCLKCGQSIHTDDRSERLCENCRAKNKKYMVR